MAKLFPLTLGNNIFLADRSCMALAEHLERSADTADSGWKRIDVSIEFLFFRGSILRRMISEKDSGVRTLVIKDWLALRRCLAQLLCDENPPPSRGQLTFQCLAPGSYFAVVTDVYFACAGSAGKKGNPTCFRERYMFGKVPGTSEVLSLMSEWAELASKGSVVSLDLCMKPLIRASRLERKKILQQAMGSENSLLRIFCAKLCLQITLDESTKEHAVEVLAAALSSGAFDATCAMWQLADVEQIPSCLSSNVLFHLNSPDQECAFAAVACAAGFYETAHETYIAGHARLVDFNKNCAPDLKFYVAMLFAKYSVRVEENSEFIAEVVATAAIDEVLILICQLSQAYSSSNQLRDAIIKKLEKSVRETDLANTFALATRKLGLVYKEDTVVRDWLENLFFEASPNGDYMWHLGVGIGVASQRLQPTDEFLAKLVDFLRSDDVEFRYVAASLFEELGKKLSEELFELIQLVVNSEPNDEVRHRLFNALAGGGIAAIKAGIDGLIESPVIIRPNWVGVCARHLEDFTSEFLAAYFAKSEPVLDEYMPSILQMTEIKDEFLCQTLSNALSSDCEYTRRQALFALSGSGKTIAPLSAELIHLYVNGSEDEAKLALDALGRMGDACYPWLRNFESIDSEITLHRLQRLQRILGMQENNIKDIELSRVPARTLVTFRTVAELLYSFGPMSFRDMEKALASENANQTLGSFQSLPASTIRRHIDTLESSLRLNGCISETDTLLEVKPGSPSGLTETGREWRLRVEKFLEQIGVEISQ